MTTPSKAVCPFCSDSRLFAIPHGLRVHMGRHHKDVPLQERSALVQSLAQGPVSSSQVQQSINEIDLKSLAKLKRTTRVLRHIPKGARNLAAGRLCELIDRCIEVNGTDEWFALLSFAFSALRTPDKGGSGTLTSKVKENIACTCSYFSESLPSKNSSLIRTIEAKVHEGDLRGAVRLLMSNDSIAQSSPETLASLKSKHPCPSRELSPFLEPQPTTPVLTVRVEHVAQAIDSFYSGSAAGLDGIRPAHLKELTASSAGDNGPRLLQSLTRLCNFLLGGQLNSAVCPYLYGASLCALSKKDGSIRPIAVGSTLRRLVAKLGCGAVKSEMADYLQPHQLGFGTPLGCEAAIHAARGFANSPTNEEAVIIKLDIKNAFNTLERDILLEEVREKVPFLFQVYSIPSNLFYEDHLIPSQVGAQQGDPLGPLTFSLAIHKVITKLKSPLNIWYLDDGTIGGKPEVVESDLRTIIPLFKQMGLEVNTSKCEFYACSVASNGFFQNFLTLIPGLNKLDFTSFNLLGSPIFPEGIPEAVSLKQAMLETASSRLKQLSAHVALVLLRLCFAIPKISYLLRTAPVWLCAEEVCCFDETLKQTLEEIVNVKINDDQWCQASLPSRHGGLGIRRVKDVCLPAFIASSNGVTGLVAKILGFDDGGEVCIPHLETALALWKARVPNACLPENTRFQRSWDDILCKDTIDRLIARASGSDLARLRAVTQPESGAWLHALPAPSLGTLLDDNSLRVAAALRLGCDVCEPHVCICGSTVESSGHHALSCQRCSGRHPRHHALNDIIRRALVSANVPCTIEPPGLCRTDGKRPDGMTLVPWQRGRCLLWDATCVSTFSACHLERATRVGGSAAESAALKKHLKYKELSNTYLFIPVAVETTGCWGGEAKSLIKEIGRRLREKGYDPRSGSYLVQRLSVAIQRGNAASIMGTFAPGTVRGGLFDD